MKKIACLAILVVSFVAAGAATPPALINYQGVLRNASDDPQNGSFDMQFAFYSDSSCGGGTGLLLTDSHLAGGAGDVVVTGGLFNVQLGSGIITPGTAVNLADMFRDNAAVYLEARVEGPGGGLETLCPRTRLTAAAYSLNADNLDGLSSSRFLRGDTNAMFTGRTLTIENHFESGEGILRLDTAGFTDRLIVDGPVFPILNIPFSAFGDGSQAQFLFDVPGGGLYVQHSLEVGGTGFFSSVTASSTIFAGSLTVPNGTLCVDNDNTCLKPVNGHIKAFVYDAAGHSDVAEVYPSSEALEPGDVVVLDADATGKVKRATVAHEDGILAVVSSAPGVLLGSPTDEEMTARGLDASLGPNFHGTLLLVPGTYPIALVGRVPVKVTSENGPIRRGDPLTSSSTPGVAMKATRAASTIGRALEPWSGKGVGTITVWVAPGSSSLPSSSVAGEKSAPSASIAPGVASHESAGTITVSDSGGDACAQSSRPERAGLVVDRPFAEAVEAGDVVVMDPDRPGMLRRSNRASDATVAGIAAGASAESESSREALAPLALSGIVLCKVDAGFGAVRVGDLLTTSPTPGHAMRSADGAPGTILGKALAPLESGTGTIEVLVMLR